MSACMHITCILYVYHVLVVAPGSYRHELLNVIECLHPRMFPPHPLRQARRWYVLYGCMHARLFACVCVFTLACISTHIQHAHTHACPRARMHARERHACTHTTPRNNKKEQRERHARTHACTHARTHTRTHAGRGRERHRNTATERERLKAAFIYLCVFVCVCVYLTLTAAVIFFKASL